MFVISFIMQGYWRRQCNVTLHARWLYLITAGSLLVPIHFAKACLHWREYLTPSGSRASIFAENKPWTLVQWTRKKTPKCWGWRTGISCQNRIAERTLFPAKGTRKEIMKKWLTEHNEGSYLWIFSFVASFGVHVFGGLKPATSRIW